MKILAFGDIHMANHKAFAQQTGTMGSTRVRAILDSLGWVVQQVDEHQPDLVVCTGDLIHFPQESNYYLLRMLAKYFERLCTRTDVRVLVGNHDANERPAYGYPYQRAVQHVVARAAWVIDKPEYEEGIAYLPYYKDLEKGMDTVRPAHLVFCHTDIQEHPYGGKRMGPSIEDFAASYIYSGHVHRGQVIQEEDPGFEYVGALLPTNFADQGEEYGALLLDWGDEGVQSQRLLNPYAVPFRKAMSIEGGARPAIEEGAYYLIDVHGAESFCLEEAERLRQLENVKVRVHVDLPDVKVEEEEEEEEEVPSRYADGLLERWAEAHGVDPEMGQKLYRGEEV